MGRDIFLIVPRDTENYFQSLGNIPTCTSQFLQAPICLSVVPLAQWQGLVLQGSKYSWMCLLEFYLFVLQHDNTTPLDSLTLLGLVISCSSKYQHVPPPYFTTGFRVRDIVQCNLQVETSELPPLRPVLVRHCRSYSLSLCLI